VSVRTSSELISSYTSKKLQICKSSSVNSKTKFSQCHRPVKRVSSRPNLISSEHGSSESKIPDYADNRLGELRHKTGILQDYLRQEMPAHLDVIVKAKTYAGETLKGIREFAESHGP